MRDNNLLCGVVFRITLSTGSDAKAQELSSKLIKRYGRETFVSAVIIGRY